MWCKSECQISNTLFERISYWNITLTRKKLPRKKVYTNIFCSSPFIFITFTILLNCFCAFSSETYCVFKKLSRGIFQLIVVYLYKYFFLVENYGFNYKPIIANNSRCKQLQSGRIKYLRTPSIFPSGCTSNRSKTSVEVFELKRNWNIQIGIQFLQLQCKSLFYIENFCECLFKRTYQLSKKHFL